MSNSDSAPATKADLDRLRDATKADLNQAVDRLDAKIDRVAMVLVQTQAGVSRIQSTIETSMDTKMSKILTAIDAFAGKSQANDRAVILHGQVLTEVGVQLKDHERRIKTLETRPGT